MWTRLPVWARAIVSGVVVATIPAIVWSLLVAVNIRATPGLPWSAPLMAVLLWLSWRYLARRHGDGLRGRSPGPRVWGIALMAGGSGVAALWSLFIAVRGMLHLTPPGNELLRYPVVTVAAAIITSALVAAVAEEAGFRGYMQVPLERAYGPATAIAVTSILFTLAHFTHGRAIVPFLPFYLAGAVVYGLLAFFTGSILPSLVLHFALDLLYFTIRYVAAREGIVRAATGTIEIVPLITFAVFIVAAVMAFRVLARLR